MPSINLGASHSPLQVRTSLSRLQTCSKPWDLLLRLLYPYPWHFHPVLWDYKAGLTSLSARQSGILQLHSIPLFRKRDTAICSLYRLCEDLHSHEHLVMSRECEYFFFHNERSWQLSEVADPEDPDPVRYAMLASTVEVLVQAFNWRLELGLRRDGKISTTKLSNFTGEEAPTWAAQVPPLETTLVLEQADNAITDELFWKRNIKASTGYLYSI